MTMAHRRSKGRPKLHGALASGHAATTAAGLRMLQAGGNAFDAVFASMATACVVEPVLASLGGGGFLIARRATGSPQLFDFFVQTPMRRGDPDPVGFYPVQANFGTTQQEFHIGCGSVATPGVVAGLVRIHSRLGRLPRREILAPAIEHAATGIKTSALQADIFTVVAPIYQATPAATAIYANQCGQPLTQTALAETLAWIAAEGDAPFYHGDLAARLERHCADHGGHLTRRDLAAYQVIQRRPLHWRYGDYRIANNPAPSVGGILLRCAMAELAACGLADAGFGSLAHLSHLTAAMSATERIRKTPDKDGIHAQAYRDATRGNTLCSRGTTHISAIDSAGNCAGLTLSNGSGSGQLLPDSGIMLNNMLGEQDLNPDGFHRWPCNTRVGSMMCPTLAQGPHQTIITGSGGSNRLRSAILQTLVNLIDFAMTPAQAVDAPRLHLESATLDIEPGFGEEALDLLRARYPRYRQWPTPNLYFGGAHSVCWDGRQFSGAGDARREGVFGTV